MTQPDDLAEVRAAALSRALELNIDCTSSGVWYDTHAILGALRASGWTFARTPDLAGHRVNEEHDCFQVNCRGLGPEVLSLRAAVSAGGPEAEGDPYLPDGTPNPAWPRPYRDIAADARSRRKHT